MQVNETKSENLSREFEIAIPADQIEERVLARLKELAKQVRLPGFRPGKAPVTLLRKQYGPNVMGEVLEQMVNETSQNIMEERGLRPAMQPQIEVTKFEDGSDLEYKMGIEILPEIELGDFSELKLERMVAEPKDEDIDGTLERISQAYKTAEPIKSKRAAKTGDILVIDFLGSVDGEEFAGGKAEDYSLELGSNSFIPGFEDQLVGAKADTDVEVNVTFPEEYGSPELAGKDALFKVKVKELQQPIPAPIDDELAKKVGMDDLEALKNQIREDHVEQYKTFSRQRLKRVLLDDLSDQYDFEVPQGLTEREFESIWNQYEEHMKQGGEEDEEDAAKSEDEKKEEFRTIAERRVRLGLLLAEVGRANNLQVGQEDINRGMMAEAQKYPGQEQAVLEYFRNNPEAMESISAPLFEEKVVDFIVEMASVTDKPVSVEELMRDPDEEAEEEEKPKAKAKKPAAKKPAAKKAAAKKPAAKKPATKKKAEDKADDKSEDGAEAADEG